MILDAPCYQAPIVCLTYLLGVAESDQLVGRVIVGVMHCFVVTSLPGTMRRWCTARIDLRIRASSR